MNDRDEIAARFAASMFAAGPDDLSAPNCDGIPYRDAIVAEAFASADAFLAERAKRGKAPELSTDQRRAIDRLLNACVAARNCDPGAEDWDEMVEAEDDVRRAFGMKTLDELARESP